MIAAVDAVFSFLEAVEAFEPDTQALAQLPDEVGTGVMTEVIELAQVVVSSRSELCPQTVQIDVPVTDGRAELVAPLVRKASHRAPIRQGPEVAVALERGVAVQEPGVIPLTAHTMTVNSEHLKGIIFRNINANTQVQAPSEDVMSVAQAILCADIAEEGAELHVSQSGLFITRVEPEVRHGRQRAYAGVRS